MKHRLTLLFAVLLTVFGCRVLAQVAKPDTIFILNKPDHKIFIDNNKESKFYNQISDFSFDDYDERSYNYSLQHLRKHNLELKKSKPVLPWRNWVMLYVYRGKYYVYKPSDFYFHGMLSINDSTLIDWTGEGPVANKILEQKQVGKNSYQLNVTGMNEQSRTLSIQVDPETGIAIYEDASNVHEKRRYLMIASEKIRTVPIIVNYSPTEKQEELKFDPVYFGMEKGKKRK